jgi:ABC-type amino acid transport substrate-binding protein
MVFIPVQRDQLLPWLAAGKGDIAAASLTITPERRKLVDFTAAGMKNVSEVVVSGPASPKVASLDDLSGKEIFVRKSSSYYESLVALNQKFAAEKNHPVALKEAPESMEDEDLLEMLNAGLIPLIIVNKHQADFWKQSSRSSPCMTTSRFAPGARSPGRCAKAVRNSRRCWTISQRATRPGP